MSDLEYDLIVTIVERGWAEKVLEASRAAGAEGGTILCGRGTGIHEKKKLLGIPIEPEKEIVLTLVPREQTETVFESITCDCELDQPATGITFVIDVKSVAGIHHALRGENSP